MTRREEATETGSEPAAEERAQLSSLKDAMRSMRRWQELLGPIERQLLLAEIARVALAIGRDLYPDNHLDDRDVGVATSPIGDTCPRERLAFLAAAWPRLSRALERITAAPATHLHPGERYAITERGSLRHVTPTAIQAALRAGDFVTLDPEAPMPFLAERLGGRLPRRIAERAAVPTCDTPENRAVKALLAQLARDLYGIAALATQANAPGVAREAEGLREEVRRHLRQYPWQTLRAAPRITLAATAAATNPAYRYLFDFWRRYRRAFAFDWTNPLFTLPTRDTWQLYEYWCLFTVADALRDLGYRCTHADGFALSRPGLTFALTKGQATGLAFVKGEGEPPVTLTYSATFSRGKNAAAHSRSHTMHPDIALESGGQLLLLDAKFKTYAESGSFAEKTLRSDIHQMHAYRDAIRGAGDRRIVQGAWLLYAGRREGMSPPVAAYPKVTAAHPFGHGDVGALLTRPGGDHSALRRMLALFLSTRPEA